MRTFASNTLGVSGLFQSTANGLNRQIADLNTRRDAFQTHLDQLEQRYRTQFAALDAMIGSMNQTSAFLQQQFSTLPKQSSK